MDEFKNFTLKSGHIQTHFAAFFGTSIADRTTNHDSSVFESGSYKSLGRVLEDFCQHLEERLAAHNFHPDEMRDGGAGVRIRSAIKSLRSMAAGMKKSKDSEPEDWHWVIIGDLVFIIASILDHIEGKGHTKSLPPVQ